MCFVAQLRSIPKERTIFRMCPSSMLSCFGKVRNTLPLQQITRLCVANLRVCAGAHSFSIRRTSSKDAVADIALGCHGGEVRVGYVISRHKTRGFSVQPLH